MIDQSDTKQVRVWDLFVRLFHWALVALIATAWLSAGEWQWGHERIGYTIAALIASRVIWGFVGTRHARFADFMRGPRTVLKYLQALLSGQGKRYLGHNPAGGAMIAALLGVTALTALTGWMQTTDRFWGSSWLHAVHESLATAILVLVAFHVAGVAFESLRHRENLVRSMITGRKQTHLDDDE